MSNWNTRLVDQPEMYDWKTDHNGYDTQKDQIYILDRINITIFHLQTDHPGLRPQLQRLGLL